MAATYPWRSPPPGSSFYFHGTFPTPPSTVRIRKRSRDAIPPGAVTSRVNLLQKLRGSFTPKPSMPTPKRTREDTRSGFGRRQNRRFGNPAIQSAQPDESSRVESRHSFLGLHIVRTNHEEEHGFADSGVQYSRSPGINGQIEQCADQRVQYDAVSPWGVLSRNRSAQSMGRHGKSPDLDVLKEINSSGHHEQIKTQRSVFPSTAQKDNVDTYRRQVKPQRSNFKESEDSVATTSTIRRQNVRDLFEDYGIRRPAGLTSREVSYDMGGATFPMGSQKYCHVCSWSNSRSSVKCWRCNHRFCVQCSDRSTQPPTTREEGADYDRELPRTELMSKENRVIDEEPVKQTQPTPDLTPLQPRKEIQEIPYRNASSPPVKFPDFYELSSPTRTPRKIPPGKKQAQASVLYGHRTTTSVKNSPFVIADLKSPTQSLRLFPVSMQGESQPTLQHHSKQHRAVNFSSASEAASCDSLVCRATHYGHQPFRHAVSCPRKKPNHHLPEDTKNGYIADTSLVDDAANISSRCHTPTSRPVPRLEHHPESPYSHLICTSRPDSLQSQILKTDYSIKHDVPEYVECRSYPRTGHARHGSPVAKGIVGECQHCLDDCECAACQNTHHSVRCCVHTDHRTVVHHHHTPQMETTAPSPENASPKKTAKSPPAPHSHGGQKVLSQSKHTHPLVSSTSQNVLAEQKSVANTHALEKSKRSALSKEVSKPRDCPSLTSIPWKDSKYTTNAGPEGTTGTTANNGGVGRDTRETALLVKEESTTRPHTSHEQSSFKASAKPATRTWFTIPSQHEHEYIHKRRESCTISSTKNSDAKGAYATSPGPCSLRTPSPPQGSAGPPRTPSTSFHLNKPNSVQALTQQVLGHQEELKNIQQECRDKIDLSSRSAVTELAHKIGQREAILADKETRTPSISSKASGATSGSKRKNWKLKLVGWDPEVKKTAGKEHNLSNDEIVGDEKKKGVYKAQASISSTSLNWMEALKLGGKEHNLSVDEIARDVMEHECVWKKKFEVGKRNGKGHMSIMGVTVLIHLAGREDLVVRADSWTGGEIKVGG